MTRDAAAIAEALEAALRYRAAGLAVLPVGRDKKPLLGSWREFQDRLPTEGEVHSWWKRWPWAGSALICGAVSGGLAVLDIDDPGLADQMAADVGLTAEVPLVRTPRGGVHLYLTEAESSRSGPLVPGLADLKAGGGYVVAPPTPGYKRLNDVVRPFAVQNARKWATETLAAFGIQPSPSAGGNAYEALAQGEPLHQGEGRNNALTSLAGALRRMGHGPETLLATLRAVNAQRCQPPLADAEVETIARSVARYQPIGEADVPGPASEWPADAAEEAFHGLAGKVVEGLEPYTEADPHALLTDLLLEFASAAGPDAHFRVGNERHGLRLNAVLAGPTSSGRKGHAHATIRGVMRPAAPAWAAEHVKGGLSSGEGLIWAVRDPMYQRQPVKERGRVIDYQDVEIDPGVTDKRLLVVESEFSRTLKVMAREGSILSAVVRQAWDSGDLRVLTRNTPYGATGAHICLLGHITPDELRRNLDSTEAGNGFGNRFLWQVVRRSKLLPDGAVVPEGLLDDLAGRLREALGFAATAGEMRRDPGAAEIWRAVYPHLTRDRGGLFGALTARAEAQTMRLACVYALMDLSTTVRPPHLLAALAFWERAEASVRYLFGDATGDPIADTILRALRAQGPLSQTAISGLFHRNVNAERLARALGTLLEAGLVESEGHETDGRAAMIWRARGPNSSISSNSSMRSLAEVAR